MSINTTKTLNPSPFKNMVMTVGNLPSSFVASMSYYEALAWLCHYLETEVIPTVNNNSEVTAELQEKFVELKDFVENYFENLDVQEEINNKLDEMAEDGELSNIIALYINPYFNVIFPNYGAEGSDTLGDCAILQNGDKSLMIDTFNGPDIEFECYQGIKRALRNAHIETLDYLVITHYHADHIGNVINLLTDGYLDGCTVYLPRVCESYPNLNGSAIKSALESAGVTWIEINNQSFTVGDDLNIQMLNGSAEDYQYYEDLADSDASYNNPYNDRSIVCDVEYKGRHLLFTGDLEYTGCEYITPKLSSSSYDLLKDCHHGYINNAPDFCAKVNPDYVVIPASIGMVNKNYSTWLVNSVYWVRKSKNVAFQGYQDSEMIFKIDMLGVHCDNIYFVNNLSCDGITEYYVDSTTTSFIRTGSKKHPFKTLQEAMIFLQKDTPEEIKVNVLSLELSDNKINILGFKNLSIYFADDVEVNSDVFVKNCTRITLDGLNIVAKKTLNIYRSNVILNNYSNSGGGRCVYSTMSNVEFTGTLSLTINSDHAIVSNSNSDIALSTNNSGITLNYVSANKRLFDATNSNIKFNSDAISDLNQYPSSKIISRVNMGTTTISKNADDLLAIYKDNTGTFSGGNLEETINNYNVVTVMYIDDSDNSHIETVDRWHKYTMSTISTNASSTETYIKSAELSFSGTTFTITKNTKTTIKNDGTISISTGNYIKVTAIIGRGGWA